MTKKECAIVMAYTGITMLSGEDFRIYHRYIEDIMGRPVWTHELASDSVVKEIKEKSRYDFLKLCESAKFAAPDDSSKIERSQLVDLFDRFRKRVSKHQEKVLDEDMNDSGDYINVPYEVDRYYPEKYELLWEITYQDGHVERHWKDCTRFEYDNARTELGDIE